MKIEVTEATRLLLDRAGEQLDQGLGLELAYTLRTAANLVHAHADDGKGNVRDTHAPPAGPVATGTGGLPTPTTPRI